MHSSYSSSAIQATVSQSVTLSPTERQTDRETRDTHPVAHAPLKLQPTRRWKISILFLVLKNSGSTIERTHALQKADKISISSSVVVVVVVVAIRKTYHPPTQRTSHLSVQLKGFCCIVSGLLQPPSIPQPPLTTLLAESLLLVTQLPPRVSLHPPSHHHHHHHKAIMHVPFLRSEEVTLSYNYIVNYVIYSGWSLI